MADRPARPEAEPSETDFEVTPEMIEAVMPHVVSYHPDRNGDHVEITRNIIWAVAPFLLRSRSS
jgi:hypothetical protein